MSPEPFLTLPLGTEVMTIYYSSSTRGFYDSGIHTSRQIPADAVAISDNLRVQLLAAESAGQVISTGTDGIPIAIDKPAPTQAELAVTYRAHIQAFMDAKAAEYGYTDLATAVTYADEPAVVKYQDEGKGLRAWRSLVWSYWYALVAEAEASNVELPTLDDVRSNLPELEIEYSTN